MTYGGSPARISHSYPYGVLVPVRVRKAPCATLLVASCMPTPLLAEASTVAAALWITKGTGRECFIELEERESYHQVGDNIGLALPLGDLHRKRSLRIGFSSSSSTQISAYKGRCSHTFCTCKCDCPCACTLVRGHSLCVSGDAVHRRIFSFH